MAITYLVNYDANGNQDVTLEFDSYDEASISGLRYTDAYHGLQWLTFGSVAIEALSTDDINNGYSGYVKIVAQNRSNDNTNMVFFIEEASTAFSGPGDYSMNMSILLLSGDWMNLWWQSGLISGTYMNNLQYGNTNWYRLDSDASDGVGSANGTATNVTFQSGEGRDYAYFDGSGSKIDLGQSSNMGIGGTDDFTVSAWIRPDTLNMASGQIFGTVVTGATSPQYAGFQFYIDNGVLHFMIGGNGYDTISYTLPAGLEYIWSHFAVSRSGTEVKMYMNGTLVQTGTTSAVHNITTSDSGHLYTIGSYYSPYNNTWYTGFEGGIDEVDVWNRRLSDSEISDYYANTNIVPPATVAIDQDVTAASIGDVLTATVDLQGGNLEYFAWELDGTIVAGGEGSPVVSLTVTEAMSEQPIAVAIRVDGIYALSSELFFPVLQSLVGHWSFDNGNAVADVGTDGAATGVDFITDSGRTVASFDASAGEKIHFGDVDEVDFGTGDFSVGAWVNFNSISTGTYASPVVYKGLTSLANWNGYALSAYQGQMRFMIGGANGWIRAEAPITAGDWHHVVGTREGAVIKLYIDGSLVDTQTDSLTRDVSTHLPLTFGSINNGTEYNGLLDAMVDDVRAYSKALNASEVATLHTETTVVPTPETTLEGYWSFDSDGSPTVGSDTFTLANGTTFASDSGRDAAYFPNTNSMMYASPKISLGSEFTISVWFKDLKDNSSSHAGWLQMDAYSASGTNGLPSSPNVTNIAVNPSGYLGGFDGSNFQSSGHEMTQALYNGTGWHHLVATSDGSTIKYYIDGIQVGNAVTMAGSAGIQVINGWSNYARTFASYLDDLRVYSMVLDANQVSDLHIATTVSEEEPAPSGGTVDLTVFSSDSYGDGWNNGSVLITDANGDTVQNFTGPASGVIHPAGLTETMTVTGGATYTYSVTPGSYPGEIAMTISDSEGNVLVTLAGTSGTGTFDAPAAPAESSSYDWTHGGQLTNIVKFSRGVDALGNPSFAYVKKEDDNTATLYLTSDIQDFAQFSSNATGATGIVGSPVCMEYGPGKLFMGTSTGNAYEIEFNGNTITSVLELHVMAGGESVREAKYDNIQNQWIFEAGEKIFTVVPGTTTAVERYVLPAGAKCMDIAPGDSGVAIIIKKADHSLSPIIATAGWTEISDEAAMVASLNTLGVADFNYDYVMDKWVAASASGQVLLADDLLQFLGSSGSPPLPG